MDSFEAVKVVHERILKLEPETIARKVVGYVYLQDYPDQEMIRLALGPDNLIQALIEKAKVALNLIPISPPISPSIRYARFPSLSPRQRVLPPRLARWNHQLVLDQRQMDNPNFIGSPPEDYRFSQLVLEQRQMDNPNFIGSPPEDYRFGDQFIGSVDPIELLNLGASGVKTCHYFNKGFCKHGSNCRYSHGQSFPENYPHMFDLNLSEHGNEDQVFSHGSLEILEMEITELLKSRGGSPISIATLPMLYYESYGRTLQAEGYLTESQRHGKAGYSLTKLLACLRNSIRLIDRPHGQHAVILAEDALKYLGSQGERYDPDTIFSSLHQIYLTFPAESAFSEEDVSNYFSTFGPVQDVRIPCQQRRMFGFVTFVSSDTVKIILAKGNPHYVCGARVLVKPYREKSKLVERKYNENLETSSQYPSHHMVTTAELQARSIREQLLEAHRKALEREMMRLSNLKLAQRSRSLSNQSYFGYSMDEPKVSEDHITFPSAEQFNYLLDVLNSVPLTDDQESNQGIDLPDSPFASVVASSISAII